MKLNSSQLIVAASQVGIFQVLGKSNMYVKNQVVLKTTFHIVSKYNNDRGNIGSYSKTKS